MGGSNGGNPGIQLARNLIRQSDYQTAADTLMRERLARDWEALTPNGKDLRDAENYAAAYKIVCENSDSKPKKYFYWFGMTAGAVPAWQALRLVENAIGQEMHSPASFDALRAGLMGAKDARDHCGCK